MTPIKEGDKLYIVTRSDISPGYQAVQSCHALRLFTEEHPMIDEQWYKNSNYIALLSVNDEKSLLSLVQKATNMGYCVSVYREPDVDDAITAIAIEPASKKLLRNIPLALIER